MKLVFCLLFFISVTAVHAGSFETGCWFLRNADVQVPARANPIRVRDFLIHAKDSQLVRLNSETIERSAHFLQTELGWRFPFTRKELGRPVLEVHFVAGKAGFTGTVISGPVLLLNEQVLTSKDFPAIWMHYVAHAATWMYRAPGKGNQDTWFYEATAGWMEGQFAEPGSVTRLARSMRRLRPELPLDDSTPAAALGASLLLDQISRPFRDVIRQSWEQWSYSGEPLMDVLSRVLQLNHLPGLNSYLLNHFLRTPQGTRIDHSSIYVVLQPYSAAVFEGGADESPTGGIRLAFEPVPDTSPFSASLIYYSGGEKQGTLAIQESARQTWATTVPYGGMARYKMVLMNASNKTLRGTLVKQFDSTIPAVLEYFRATAEEEGGTLLEWKSSRENGVAFWNVYRIQNGVKERLNELPLPAGLNTGSGMNYMFVDYRTGSYYSLEALTGEGFSSSVAATSIQSGRKDPRSNDRED